MAPKNTKSTQTTKPVAKVAKAAQPKVDPTKLTTPQIYSGEQERQAAIAEVTRLRREFDTTTSKGAKAFAADPEAQAALARLDAAKSAVGMRTAAQDLQALNTLQGKGQTRALNQPSQQYFQSVYGRGELKPLWEAPAGAYRKDAVNKYLEQGYDIRDSYFTWSWDDKDKQWKVQALGPKYVGKLENYETAAPDKKPEVGLKYWEAGKVDLQGYINLTNKDENDGIYLAALDINVDGLGQIARTLPNITWKQFYATVWEALDGKPGKLEPFQFVEAYQEIFGRNEE